MSKRPEALNTHLAEQKEKNDGFILKGLGLLEERASWATYKATVKGLQEIIKDHCQQKISSGAIRNRDWALAKLKAIKNTRKSGGDSVPKVKTKVAERKEQLTLLRERVRSLLEQNAIFYEEILALQELIERKDAELEVLTKKLQQCQDSKIVKLR